jgi:hypothetical protein
MRLQSEGSTDPREDRRSICFLTPTPLYRENWGKLGRHGQVRIRDLPHPRPGTQSASLNLLAFFVCNRLCLLGFRLPQVVSAQTNKPKG